MNPESENTIPSPNEGESNTYEASSTNSPEGFYNPEKERVPVPRTEAARTLTKLVEILSPGSVNLEGIDNRHQVDAVATEFQEVLVPTTTGNHKNEFLAAIGPFLTRLEKIGFGDYAAKPQLKNIENFTVTDDEKIVFNNLYSPWQYGPNGRVIPNVDIKKLRQVVDKLADWPEADLQIKMQAELYVDTLESSLEEEMSQPAETLIDRLDEPSLEHMDIIQNTLDLISEDMIDQVSAISVGTEAKNNSDRDLMRSLTAPLVTLMKSLNKHTKIGADFDQTRYPEFWQLADKYQRINCAIGIINTNRNDVRHDISPVTITI